LDYSPDRPGASSSGLGEKNQNEQNLRLSNDGSGELAQKKKEKKDKKKRRKQVKPPKTAEKIGTEILKFTLTKALVLSIFMLKKNGDERMKSQKIFTTKD
jgi:hypothetical protein